jgi:membrane-associated protein
VFKNIFRSRKKFVLLLLVGSLVLALAVLGIIMLEHYGLKELIAIVGYPGIFAIVFAESGLFFGFFLPGDSLIVTTGLLASQDYFKILYLLIFLPFAAIAGDSVGYWFGKKVGPKIFTEKDSLLLDKRHLDNAHRFYQKYGGKTIIIARFIPIIRTFAPIVAGVAQMEYPKFLSYNVIGGTLWTIGMLSIGYFLGNIIPDVDRYLLPLIALIIFLSLLPALVEYYKHNRGKIFSNFMDTISNLSSKLSNP